MARGDGDDDSSCHRNKRRRGSGGHEDGESSHNIRCLVSAGDFSDADNSGGSGVDDMDNDNDVCGTDGDGDGDCVGEDDIYDGSDDAGGYLEEEETMAEGLQAASAAVAKKLYAVLTEDAILDRQQKAAADVAEVLSIPSSFAVVLLRHFKWRTSRVKEEWFSDERRVRDAVGMPADSVPVPMALTPGKTRSAACSSHFYCVSCWHGYIHAAVGDGPRCLSLRCPDPACSAAVVQDLVDAVTLAEDKDRYARFALRSFVEDGGGGIKWCPAPGCAHAVELVGDHAGDDSRDVFCDCRHGFCWRCSEEAHRPVSCDTVRAWLAKNSSEEETANWILTKTKSCPKCWRAIEKNQGCNHMRCSAPCGHQFCWICLDPWNNHHRCSRYNYDQRPVVDDEPAAAAGGQGKAARKEKMRRRQAKASLDRYLYHYERWAANRTSIRKTLEDMDHLQRSGLKKMAATLEIPVTELKFLTKAYELIADGRRVMRWVYAYGYYLDPVRDKAKRGLFDHLQDDANSWLESLHSCAELERRKFSLNGEGVGADAMNETYRAYKKKLEDLTRATEHYFGNLVKAFETDMPEFNSVKK
nr:probable E3 ubiquitin-protein ligase ARI10 [Setaria viridis]